VLTITDLEKFEEYIRSGDFAFDFEHAAEARKLELLDLLEKLMDLADLADETATKVIFKNSFLGMLAGTPGQDPEGEPDKE